MSDPALLHPSSVDIPAPEGHEATVLDNATTRGEEVRCIVPSLDKGLASDPMEWMPYMTVEGEFWPKRGDRAVINEHVDGPPVIVFWRPADDATPDVLLP
jgi:hypothetical protein